jgi:hypothetical protein
VLGERKVGRERVEDGDVVSFMTLSLCEYTSLGGARY